MTFQQAVDKIPQLKGQWQTGLGALRAEDKPHVQPDDPRLLRGSVDVDKAHQKVKKHAQSNRWDFAIGFQHTNRKKEFIYWLEIHTGSDSEISVMLRKLEWLRDWLKQEGKALSDFDCQYVWAPSGATNFTKRARQVKALADKGLHYAGSGFKIPSAHPRPER